MKNREAPIVEDEKLDAAAVVEEIVVGFEDAVRQLVIAHELPDVFHRVKFGGFQRQGENGDVGGNDQSPRQRPE